ERLEQFGYGRVFGLKPEGGAGHPDLRQACAKRVLSGNKGRTTGSTALLAVPVGEFDPFFGNTVDVRGSVAHHAVVVAADIPVADVIAPKDQNIGWFGSHALLLFSQIKVKIEPH